MGDILLAVLGEVDWGDVLEGGWHSLGQKGEVTWDPFLRNAPSASSR
jgi:hypothetical protein